MIELKGKNNIAKVFTDNIEPEAISQVIELLNQPFVEGAKIRIMPDVHAGAGCVIGFTADLSKLVIPNLIGVDIGCGMLTVELGTRPIDRGKLDSFIHEHIPAGRNVNEDIFSGFSLQNDLYCYSELKNTYIFPRAIGSLGGGNHFIEIDKADNGMQYLVIHTGSRNLGKQVADYYQKMAVNMWKINGLDYKEHRQVLIDGCRAEKRGYDIPAVLKRFDEDYKNGHPQYPADLCFLFGEKRNDYLHDMEIAQKYAQENRYVIAQRILKGVFGTSLYDYEHVETIHNYVNFKDNIMRKGAVSAYAGERLIIPINMRDGSLLCVGKGNADWNYSAPHGAGRLMGRNEAKRLLKLDEYKESMTGIFSTCVNADTLDESPMAYKPMDEIIANIGDTVDIVDIIHPIYNFKAGD